MVKTTPWPLYPRVGTALPILEEAALVTVSVWTDRESRKSLVYAGVQSPDRSASSQFIYEGESNENLKFIIKKIEISRHYPVSW